MISIPRLRLFNSIVGTLLCMLLMLSSCISSKSYNPVKKYAPQDLRADYTLMRNILESKHPSLYWYTSKDSMDLYFNYFYSTIRDSMTEQQFAWHVVAPLIDKIHCGHTSVSMSKAYGKWVSGKQLPSFPLYLKCWNDTMAVTANLDRKDSIFKRGTIIKSINGATLPQLAYRMFNYLPEDGHANNINYIRLSANMPYYHRNIIGLSKSYQVNYIDSNGITKTRTIPLYFPGPDSTKRKRDSLRKAETMLPHPKPDKLVEYRSLSFDSTGRVAIMTLNTFSKGHLRSFFRKSFREIRKKKIDHMILDIRSNGGGNVGLSTLLTRYVTRKEFRVADTLYAKAKRLGPYTKYISGKFLNNIELFFIAHKKADGLYHLQHLERKTFKPKSALNYQGKLYVLINGPTFSAATLFSNVIKGQPGVLLAGEEAGGGWYGNNGIMIPDIRLPNTHVRVRLPLFRLIQFEHIAEKGTGVFPDLYIGTSYDALLKSRDQKMDVIMDLIRNDMHVGNSR